MKRLAPIAAPLLLAACGERAETGVPGRASETPTSPAPAGVATEEVVSLPGEYRLAGVDGQTIDLPYAITATISANRIHVTADCVNFAWTYTASGNRIATSRAAVEGCARGLTEIEDRMAAAFDATSSVSRTPSNAVEMSGGGHRLTLFSQ